MAQICRTFFILILFCILDIEVYLVLFSVYVLCTDQEYTDKVVSLSTCFISKISEFMSLKFGVGGVYLYLYVYFMFLNKWNTFLWRCQVNSSQRWMVEAGLFHHSTITQYGQLFLLSCLLSLELFLYSWISRLQLLLLIERKINSRYGVNCPISSTHIF